MVDAEIMKLILKEALTPGDFTITNEGYCRLNPQLARKIVTAACAAAVHSQNKE